MAESAEDMAYVLSSPLALAHLWRTLVLRERWCSAVSRTIAGTSCLGDGHAWLKEWHLSDILPRGREAEKERERERERDRERESERVSMRSRQWNWKAQRERGKRV